MDRFAEITRKTQDVLALAKKLYGVDINPSISYNLRGRVAGWAGCKFCLMTRKATQFSLRFNRELIAGKHFEDVRDETVPHEVAHLVCYARPELGRKHDMGWKRVCLALGGNGKTRHDYDVVVKGRWDYMTDRGHKVSVTKRYHDHVQRGGVLNFKHGKGTIDRYSPCAPSGQPIPSVGRHGPRPQVAPTTWTIVPPAPRAPEMRVAAAAPAPRPAGKPAAGMSKAEQVRAFIREARNNGSGQDWVVTRAMINLGMPRAQALRYVSENWDRA
jgi:SprT protein